MSKHVLILGGGLAGLACGYEMAKKGIQVTILEREPVVGGMANSFEEGDRATAGEEDSSYWCHDYGPHRFHTREKELLNHVQEILGENKVWANRLSRIVLFGKFFNYPLAAKNILTSLNPFTLLSCLIAYAWVRFLEVTRLRKFEDRHFAEWVTRRFGGRLANIFFIQYTEKAWKMPATEISADWAAQRITLLNLRDTIVKTLFKPGKKNTPRTLVTEFVYPKLGGIGELARGYEREITKMGGKILTAAPAQTIHSKDGKVTHIEYKHDGKTHEISADQYISTIPVTTMARCLRPAVPEEVKTAIQSLDYVAIVFVYLKIDKPQVSPDNWVYLPEKHLTVHRISEFKNFSPYCAPKNKTMVCAEITCRVGDEIWTADEDTLREIAIRDLSKVGLIKESEVLGSFSKKVPFAYPVYDLHYGGHLQKIMQHVHLYSNLKSGGRQGLFRYNNMDQSIEMGRVMAEALLTGADSHAHEDVATGTQIFEVRNDHGVVDEEAREEAKAFDETLRKGQDGKEQAG